MSRSTVDPAYRLLDGRLVDRECAEARLEIEARSIAALPSSGQRKAWMEDLEHRRGKPAADALRAIMVRLP